MYKIAVVVMTEYPFLFALLYRDSLSVSIQLVFPFRQAGLLASAVVYSS